MGWLASVTNWNPLACTSGSSQMSGMRTQALGLRMEGQRSQKIGGQH